MVMAKHHEKGSPKRAPNEPVPGNAGSGRPCQASPLQFEQCCHCDRHHQADGLKGTGPLILTLGPLGSANDRPCHCCSCGVAPAPAPATLSVLRGSRYLRPAQELLSEVVRMADLAPGATDDEEAERQEQLEASAHRALHRAAKNDANGVQAKLLGLLSELESRQERYFGELGRVSSSFEPALEDGAAAAYTSLMRQAMARHFGNLRRAILRRLRIDAAAAAARWRPAASLREGEHGEKDDGDELVTEERVDRVARRMKLAAAARAEQAWRPLRGLPEGSVAVLRAWLLDHFLHPYPHDSEKLRLAVSTGLSRSQITNWFINARVRLWKPMVEEMYEGFSEDSDVSREDTSGASSS
ncbi:BEL1-like homeodomain protein 11 [Phragmites australis]|uniref:BEL1-like homeodomain protein 11 n=1 Tax=Phragmites australis TaxID=29695 RepID=UPI002D79849E|nr:BEL1-like homeodomain protein 11 [Phragmites australis]